MTAAQLGLTRTVKAIAKDLEATMGREAATEFAIDTAMALSIAIEDGRLDGRSPEAARRGRDFWSNVADELEAI